MEEERCCKCDKPLIASVVLKTKDIGEYETFSDIRVEKAICLDRTEGEGLTYC